MAKFAGKGMNIVHTELRADQLTIAPGGQKLIEDLNWHAALGEFWCILGQNGVGKTSLLYALAGLTAPAAGKVLINNRPLESIPEEELALLRGLMPQQQVDTFSRSVLSTVLIGSVSHREEGGLDSEQELAAAEAALSAVGLSHKAHMDVLTLSAGERQRVALACLVLQSPAVMLLDEPVAHQDVAQQLAMMHFIRDRAKNHAVVSSCHDIDLAARFATHVLVLAEGRHWQGAVDEVLTVETLQEAFDCRFELQGTGGLRSFVPY